MAETYGGEKEHHAAEREPTGVAQVTCGGDTVVNQTVTSSVTSVSQTDRHQVNLRSFLPSCFIRARGRMILAETMMTR